MWLTCDLQTFNISLLITSTRKHKYVTVGLPLALSAATETNYDNNFIYYVDCTLSGFINEMSPLVIN